MSNTVATAIQVTIPTANEMALDRTQLAHERNMMAWIRTAVSLISFGFSIYKFFDFGSTKAGSEGAISPRVFGTVMIGTGLVALAAVVIQHWRDARVLRKAQVAPNSTATIVAGLVALLGVLAMAATLLHE